MNATATTTFKTPFAVVDFAGRTLKVLGSKPAAVKFAEAQDADYVLSPAGKRVWINLSANIETTEATEATDTNTTEESDVPNLTLKRNKKAEKAAKAEATEATTEKAKKAPKAPREKAPIDPTTGRRIYKRATKRTSEDTEAITGRFELEVYGGIGETVYAQRPDATLRRALGIKWVELWELGITSQPVARRLLAELEAGTTTVAAIIEPLGLDAELEDEVEDEDEAQEDETDES